MGRKKEFSLSYPEGFYHVIKVDGVETEYDEVNLRSTAKNKINRTGYKLAVELSRKAGTGAVIVFKRTPKAAKVLFLNREQVFLVYIKE